jgi:hypothetical protein
MGLKPSMMDLGAVALRVADGGTTKAFDRTKNPVEFVFNPKTPDETKVSRDMASLSRNLGRSHIMVLVITWRSYMRMKKKFFIRMDILICTHIPCIIIWIAV